MSDDEILNLAKQMVAYPYTRIKKTNELLTYFDDIANLVGYPNSPTKLFAYKNGEKYIDRSKMKIVSGGAPLYKMYKSEKLSIKDYSEIQKALKKRYEQLLNKFYQYTTGISSYGM